MSTNSTPSLVHRVTSLRESSLWFAKQTLTKRGKATGCIANSRDARSFVVPHVVRQRDASESLLRKPLTDRNILQIVQNVQETICKKQLIESSTNLLLSISGGQDSIFLLFCLSFVQTQISFTFKVFWCNHFWQTDSFYTTLHLTKYGVNLSFPLLTFIPLHDFCLKYSEINLKNNQALTKLLASREFAMQTVALPRFARVCFGLESKLPRSEVTRCTSCITYTASVATGITVGDASNTYKAHALLKHPFRDASKASERDTLCRASRRKVKHVKRRFAKQTLAGASPQQCKRGALYAIYRKQKICQKQIQGIKESKNLITIMHLKKFTFFNLDNVCNSFFQNFLPFRRQSWQISHNYVPSKKIEDLFSEGIARNWRHITTERSSSFYALEKTIYGHTLSDKIETMLFNLIRGAGKRGITPLLWKRKSSKFSYNKFYCSFERIQKNTHLDCI